MSAYRVPAGPSQSLVAIPRDWRPCHEHMLALPEPLRAYVRFLETNNDPERLREANLALAAENEKLHKLLAEVTT